MTITINGEPHPLPRPATLAQLLAERQTTTGVAVALNGAFIARETYAGQMVRDGDSIEILSPMQGG